MHACWPPRMHVHNNLKLTRLFNCRLIVDETDEGSDSAVKLKITNDEYFGLAYKLISAYQFSVPCTLFHPHTQRTPHQVIAGWSLLVSCHHFEVVECFPIHTPAYIYMHVRQTIRSLKYLWTNTRACMTIIIDLEPRQLLIFLQMLLNFTHFS